MAETRVPERPERIVAPWTPEQVEGLNRWQAAGHVHPFTCAGCTPSRDLVVTAEGWRCYECGHFQTWAHAFMADGPPPPPFADLWRAPQGGGE